MCFSQCKLFSLHLHSLCTGMCLSLWLFVLAKAHLYDFTLRTVCALLSIPHGVSHCAASGCTPFAHRLYWGGYWAGIALILKETLFSPSLQLHRFREVNGFRPLVGIRRKRYLGSSTPVLWLRVSGVQDLNFLRWMKRRSDVSRRELLQSLQQGLIQLPLEALE